LCRAFPRMECVGCGEGCFFRVFFFSACCVCVYGDARTSACCPSLSRLFLHRTRVSLIALVPVFFPRHRRCFSPASKCAATSAATVDPPAGRLGAGAPASAGPAAAAAAMPAGAPADTRARAGAPSGSRPATACWARAAGTPTAAPRAAPSRADRARRGGERPGTERERERGRERERERERGVGGWVRECGPVILLPLSQARGRPRARCPSSTHASPRTGRP